MEDATTAGPAPPPSFSVQVKAEYILSEPHPFLAAGIAARNPNGPEDATISKASSRKRKDGAASRTAKLCHSIAQGNTCPYGDLCKYSHDMKLILSQRLPDIAEIPLCPLFQLHGHCPFGVQCRMGACHLNLSTGDNITSTNSIAHTVTVMNTISKDTQLLLRKRQYHFTFQRRKQTKETTTTETDTPADTTIISNPTTAVVMDPTSTTTTVQVITHPTATHVQAITHTLDPPTLDLTPLEPPQTRTLIDFRNKIYIAPLTTVGNLPFRRIMKKFGADITCGEMALCTNLLQGQTSEWALLKRHVEEDVFGVQLAAGYPDAFVHTAEVLQQQNIHVDFVDLNLGCPLDLVCDKGAGAKLMQRDLLLRETLQGLTQTLSCPVTIKMRTGWEEKNPFAHKLVQKIHTWGISGVGAIMIHGRSRLQRYSKLADWDYIQLVAQSCPPDGPSRIPIIGNGDIFSYTDYVQKVEAREGLESTAMLARGALIKPWLPTEIKERRHWDISATERLDMLKDFVRFGLEHWGTDSQGVDRTRRFLLEWLSFLCRYVPVGLLEVIPQQMNHRPPLYFCGRSDLETLMLSRDCRDWIRISEMLLGKVEDGFHFEPKHKANS